MAKKTDPTQDAAKAMQDAMSQLQQMGMQSMSWMGGDWMQKMNEMGSEMMHFMAERLQKDIEWQQRMLKCRDLKELHEVQAEFMQSAIERYTEETGKLMDMGAKAMTPPASDTDK